MKFQKVVVMGLGRIGLPTASCLADAGLDVLGVDIDGDRLEQIRTLEVGRMEPGLKELVRTVIQSGRLSLSTKPDLADAFILCLPTSLGSDKTCDLSALDSALDAIAPVVSPGNLIILESTVPVHTTRDVVAPKLESLGVETDSVLFAYAPERIMSGMMLDELKRGDRVIGGLTPEAAEAARSLYEVFVDGQIHPTDASTAELVKLIENTYRDVNIAFANEIALFCERDGIDAWKAIELANRHPRVNIHRPGAGVGGHCIPVVPHFLAQGTSHDLMIQAAREVNESMPRYVSNLVSRAVSGMQRPKVALMGVSYKANSPDPINSPTIHIAEFLKRERFEVVLCDPLVEHSSLEMVDLEEALGSDCLVFLMAHDVFRDLAPRRPRRGRGVLIDIVNCVDLGAWKERGWHVRGFAAGGP